MFEVQNSFHSFSGFLAVGTETGVIGICVTDTADHITFEEQDLSRRLNFNLRGHHSRFVLTDLIFILMEVFVKRGYVRFFK
jgi:hypothetical protein